MVFTDGLTSQDYFPVLWGDRKGRAGYKYPKHGGGSVYRQILNSGNAIKQAQSQPETNLQRAKIQ